MQNVQPAPPHDEHGEEVTEETDCELDEREEEEVSPPTADTKGGIESC